MVPAKSLNPIYTGLIEDFYHTYINETYVDGVDPVSNKYIVNFSAVILWIALFNIILDSMQIYNSVYKIITSTITKYEKLKVSPWKRFLMNFMEIFNSFYLLITLFEANFVLGFRGSACFGDFLSYNNEIYNLIHLCN